MTEPSVSAPHPVAAPRVVRMRTRLEFERALRTSPVARSTHFALHRAGQLSTGEVPEGEQPVDDCVAEAWRLGVMIPKRWARRSVTRSLLKRQCRAQFALAAPGLVPGDWLLRLRRAFDTRDYPSAASEALRRAARAELQQLLARAAAPART